MRRFVVIAALLPLLAALTPTGESRAQEAGEGAPALPSIGIQRDSDAPMEIEADQLEASREENGKEHVVFQRNVRVRQGDLRIWCDRLEATYGTAGSGPERIATRGNVRIVQQGSELRCDRADYDRATEVLLCRSPGAKARLTRGDDQVEGDEIELHLRDGAIQVRGGARVVIPGGQAAERPKAADPLKGAEPAKGAEGTE